MSFDYEKDLNAYMFKDGKLTTVQQGKYFAEWVLIKLFNRTEDEIDNNDIEGGVSIPDGSNDKGIDCYFKDADTLYIIQCKYRQNHSYSEVNHFKGQMEEFFSRQDGKDLKPKILEVWNLLHDPEINQIKIYYVTNNNIESEAEIHDYNQISDKFENDFSVLGKSITFEIVGMESYSRIRTGILLELPSEIKSAQTDIILENSFENRDKNTVVAEVSLKNIAALVKEFHKYIFFSNIRNYKGLNKVNQEIANTYDNHPKDFWFYNNGITIVCKDYKQVRVNKNNTVVYKIFAPQIVNGCQTASTIYNKWSASSDYEKNNIDGTILVKIIKDSKEEKRRSITKYTNSQTAVTGKDFFALEDFHKELQNNFEKIGYYYEIQANSSKYINLNKFKGNIKYDILFDEKFKKKNTVIAKDVVQLYVSCILQQPGKAKNIGEYMPGGDRYDKAFNNQTPKDPRFYLIPYGIYYYFRNIYEIPAKKIDKDRWKASLLFISSIFFKVVSKRFFSDTKQFNDESFIDKCEEIIADNELFDEVVESVKDIIVDFYKDSKIRDIIGDNLPKFLKTAIESNKEVVSILKEKIDDNVE